MGHLLETRNGVASMSYNRQNGAPWHHLGKPVDGLQTAEEVIVNTNQGYEVEARAIFAVPNKVDFDGETILPLNADDIATAVAMPGKRAIFRKDTGDCFGMVSDGYKVIQNREAFSFLDKLVAGHEMRYESAGVFGKGERLWMLGVLPKDLRILNSDDLVKKYILCYNSHDGSMAFRVLFTGVRVVCWNTCSGALAEGEGKGVSIRHNGNVDEKLDLARKTLGLAVAYFDSFGDKADALARTQISPEALKAYFARLYPSEGKGAPKSKRDTNLTTRHTLTGLFEGGTGQELDTARGTAWGAYNAVTEFIDYHSGNLDGGRRLESNWLGDGARVKERAWDLILEVAGVAKTLQPAKSRVMPEELSRALALSNAAESN
jgi:phage/plasmid-like protein (TIGR03299 family)